MVICLERDADDLHMVQLMPLPPHHLLLQQNPEWFIFLVPAYPGCSGKKAVKWLCVCVCVFSEIVALCTSTAYNLTTIPTRPRVTRPLVRSHPC